MSRKTVVIVVEVVNRELDNAILLKTELERRGYRVVIRNKWEQLRFGRTDILITPNCYNRDNYEYYRYRFNAKSGLLIDLQYEQVLSLAEEDNELYSLDETAKQVMHLCWGRHTFDRLRRKNVAPEKLPITGAIQLDSARPMFTACLKTRREIAGEYGLPSGKKWLLYISSFACAEDSLISDVQKNCHELDNVDVFAAITSRSQRETLQWFERFLEENGEEYVIIYRPHPVELSSAPVRELMGKYPESFRCISDYEIKQWIRVADVPCTWLSTSIAESYFMKKNCLVLRPARIPPEVDCVIYEGVRAAESYEEFLSQVKEYRSNVENFPIRRERIEYYYEPEEEPAYRKIADVIDACVPNPDAGKRFGKKRREYLLRNHVLSKLAVKAVYRFLYRTTGWKLKSEALRSRFFVEEWEKTVDNRTNHKKHIQEKETALRQLLKEADRS